MWLQPPPFHSPAHLPLEPLTQAYSMRRGNGFQKIDIPMAPMIDVVFQLLIFFILTLRITAPEGDFNLHMPIGSSLASSEELPPLEIKVRLVANPDGTLQQLSIGNITLGHDFPKSFDNLHQAIARLASDHRRPSDDIAVEIDADYGLHYKYVLRAISACSGRYDPQTGGRIKFVENIRLTPPVRMAQP